MKEIVVKQRIWRGGQLNKDIKNFVKPNQGAIKANTNWINRPRFAVLDVTIIIVLVLIIRYLAEHLVINWR